MWAAVGHLAGEEIFEQALQLGDAEYVVALDRSAAGGGGDGILTET
jgi:hypothetical protein